MSRAVQILTMSICILTTSFKPLSIRLYLSGTILFEDKKINEPLIGFYLFVKGDNKFIAGTFTDTGGYYELDFIPDSQKSFDFFIAGPGMDTTFLKSYTVFESDVMTWDIKLPIIPGKKDEEIICPKCKQCDQVYRIVIGEFGKKDLLNKTIYVGNCIHEPMSPNWYCDRDKIKF